LSKAKKPSASKLFRHEFTLVKFGELALKSDDLDEILTEACRLVGDALGTDLAKVMELQADGETLLVRAGVGWMPGIVGVVALKAADDTSEGHALKTGEPMISPDIDQETRFTYPAFLVDHGVKAVANVLVIGGKDRLPFGILQIDSRTPRAFTEDDIAFLRSYANLLAAAVNRLRVVCEVRDSEARLRLALEAGELGSWDIDLLSGVVTRTPRHDQIFGYSCQRRSNSGSPALPVLSFRCHAAWSTRARRSGKPARPYLVRFSILSRLIWPLAGLVVQGRSRAACTAARSRRRLAANSAIGVPAASASTASRLSWLLRRNSRLSRFATAMPSARSGACARRAETNACSASGNVSVSAMSMCARCRLEGGCPLSIPAPALSMTVCGSVLRRLPAQLRTVPYRPAKPRRTSSRQSRAALRQPSAQRRSRWSR